MESDEKESAIRQIIGKYSVDHKEEGLKISQGMWDKFVIFEIEIDHLTGKSSIIK